MMNNTNRKYLVDGVATVRLPKVTRYLDSTGNELIPVVRCKDCIHREVQVDGVFRYELCGLRNEIINLEGFCHMGKRRE